MNHKFLYSVSALGLLAGISATEAKAETYMCEPCPTGYYCSNGVKNTCPSDSLCINGQKITKSSCTKKQISKYTSATTSNTILQPGIYEFEIAGGGGGGGGAFGWNDGWGPYVDCKWHGGGNGGKGNLITASAYLNIPTLLNYTVGSHGSGGASGTHNGGNGGASKISLRIGTSTSSWIASGGYGGKGATKSNGGSAGSNAGNGNGANGGGGGSGHNTCTGKSGSSGATGWITVYQWVC